MTTMTEKRMDEIMGRLLRTGVILAAAFVMPVGGLPCTSPRAGYDYKVFQGEPRVARGFRDFPWGVRTAWERLIQLGY